MLTFCLKDSEDANICKPIAIAMGSSKTTEKSLLIILENLISTNCKQIGFKEHCCTETCVFVVNDTVNTYRKLGTLKFPCFTEFKGTFDRVCHRTLSENLARMETLAFIIQPLKLWYAQQRLLVNWDAVVSNVLFLSNGIRQGSIVSPKLFKFYVDELNIIISSLVTRWYAGGKPQNNFSYADDLAILAQSVSVLNKMLAIRDVFSKIKAIDLNGGKSVVLLVLPKINKLIVKPIFLCMRKHYFLSSRSFGTRRFRGWNGLALSCFCVEIFWSRDY